MMLKIFEQVKQFQNMRTQKDQRIRKRKTALFAAAACTGAIVLYAYAPRSIDTVTDHRFSRTDMILSSNDGSSTGVNSIPAFLQSHTFCPYYGRNFGSTARVSYSFYDAQGHLLFVFTDIGNRNLCQITINRRTHLYAMYNRLWAVQNK